MIWWLEREGYWRKAGQNMRRVGRLVFLGVPITSIVSGRQETFLELKAGKWIIPLSFWWAIFTVSYEIQKYTFSNVFSQVYERFNWEVRTHLSSWIWKRTIPLWPTHQIINRNNNNKKKTLKFQLNPVEINPRIQKTLNLGKKLRKDNHPSVCVLLSSVND